MTSFEIRPQGANKTGSLPVHFDIHVKGSDESIATVWDSRELADYLVFALRAYGQWKTAVYSSSVDQSKEAV